MDNLVLWTWGDELPFRVALTQENIDRLCIKVQRPRPVPVPVNRIATKE